MENSPPKHALEEVLREITLALWAIVDELKKCNEEDDYGSDE